MCKQDMPMDFSQVFVILLEYAYLNCKEIGCWEGHRDRYHEEGGLGDVIN